MSKKTDNQALRLPKPIFIRTGNTTQGKVSGEDYKRMYQEQNGLCAICKKPETSRNGHGLKSLAVDHDHETGIIRGLLCNACNFALGCLRDDIAILKSAIEYLQSAKDRQVEMQKVIKKSKSSKKTSTLQLKQSSD